MRGKVAQKAWGLGAPRGPLASDFLLAMRGAPKSRGAPIGPPPHLDIVGGPPYPNSGGGPQDGTGGPSYPISGGPPLGAAGGPPPLYPNFEARQKFVVGPLKASFFPPHMNKGVVELQKVIKKINCLIEVGLYYL